MKSQKTEKKHQPYQPKIKRTPSEQEAHRLWWEGVLENRKRLRKKRAPVEPGVSLADRIAQQRTLDRAETTDAESCNTSIRHNGQRDSSITRSNDSVSMQADAEPVGRNAHNSSTDNEEAQVPNKCTNSSRFESNGHEHKHINPIQNPSQDEPSSLQMRKTPSNAQGKIRVVSNRSQYKSQRKATLDISTDSDDLDMNPASCEQSDTETEPETDEVFINKPDVVQTHNEHGKQTVSKNRLQSKEHDWRQIASPHTTSSNVKQQKQNESAKIQNKNQSSSQKVLDPHETRSIEGNAHLSLEENHKAGKVIENPSKSVTNSASNMAPSALLTAKEPVTPQSDQSQTSAFLNSRPYSMNKSLQNNQSGIPPQTKYKDHNNQSSQDQSPKKQVKKDSKDRSKIIIEENNKSKSKDRNMSERRTIEQYVGVQKLPPREKTNRPHLIKRYDPSEGLLKKSSKTKDKLVKSDNKSVSVSKINQVCWDSDEGSGHSSPIDSDSSDESQQTSRNSHVSLSSSESEKDNDRHPHKSVSLPSLPTSSRISLTSQGASSQNSSNSSKTWATGSNNNKIPRNLRHLGNDYHALMAFPHVASHLPENNIIDPIRVSSLPNKKTQDDVSLTLPRINSTPATRAKLSSKESKSSRLLNRLRRELLIVEMEKKVDRDIQNVFQQYS